MNFTKEQELAVRLREKNILVSAGAGAGKTRVLVNRMAEMILDENHPVSADSFLVMTFTNAAAAEMKERITAELRERLEQKPDDRRLRRQIRIIQHADISTVHSFCNHLIRLHFNEADMDPSFRIGEEGELFLFRQQAMEYLLEEAYASGRESFFQFVEAYAPGKSDQAIETLIEESYRFSRGFPNKEQWFSEILFEAKALESEENIQESRALREIMHKAKRILSEAEKEIQKGFSLFGEGKEPERFYELMKEDARTIQSLQDVKSFDELCRALQEVNFLAAPRAVKKEKEWEHLERIKEIHKLVREEIQELKQSYFLYDTKKLCQENKKLRPYLEELISLTERYEELYFQLKKEKNVYDFDDLEHIALRLLIKEYDAEGNPVPSETAEELSRKYKAVFVDEYQDTNLVQETLIRAICQKDKNHLFVVGDVKQSIYRFRQARPDLFLARYRRCQPPENILKKEDGKPLIKESFPEKNEDVRIELRDNFRSAPGVLSFCNLVFEALMEKEFGGVDYTEDIALRPGKGGPMENIEEESEMLLLVEDEEKENFAADADSLESETAMIAKRIRELIKEGFAYKDMVILLRSSAGRAEPMADFLAKAGIPAVCESKTGYFQSREVQLALNYLAVTDNVYQDIPMASVLLSSIGGLTEEELASLRAMAAIPARREYSLYDLIKCYLEEGEEENLRTKLTRFMDQLVYFRKRKKEESLHELLWEIYTKTGVYYAVQMMPEGEKRKENLFMLLQKAEEYEKSVFKGLFYFLRYMEQLRTYEVELGSAVGEDDAEDAVKIMTIHKSKGLEFPVVFVSGLSKKFNLMDGSRPVLFHPVLGAGMEFVDLQSRIRHPSFMKKAIREQMIKETLEEELRILYVAMTRAQKKLILTGIAKKKKIEEAENIPLSLEKKLSAQCFLDWLLPLSDKIAVKKIHFHELERELEKTAEEKNSISLEQFMESEEMQRETAPVAKAFSYEYPYREASSWKRKYSVSELKKLSMLPIKSEGAWDEAAAINGDFPFGEEKDRENEDIPKPAFLQEEVREVSGALRGTIIHKIMEMLPFGKIETKKDLFDELKKVEENYPQTACLSMKSVYKGAERFLFSEIGGKIRRMDKEKRLYKELPFTAGLPASLIQEQKSGFEVSAKEGFQEEERIVVQGVIDACGEDDDGLWLLDYKTDYVKEGEEGLLLDRYKTQMLYYKAALEQILHKKVKHSYIFSFALGKYLEITWKETEERDNI